MVGVCCPALLCFVPVDYNAPEIHGMRTINKTNKYIKGKSNVPFRLGLADSADDDRIMLIMYDEAGDGLKVGGRRDQRC
jgi:hypothetical protein